MIRPLLVVVCGALLLGALPAATPAAQASPGDAPIVVAGAGGTVTVTRDPFRLVVRDRAGSVVLAEVPNTAHSPSPYASAAPSVLGSTQGQTAPLYAPMTMTVGAAPTATYPGTPWAGNLLVGAVAGTQYSAQRVLTATREPHGVRLTVSTDDPTGSVLLVTVSAVARHFVVDATRSGGTVPAGSSVLLADAFASTPSEAFHGFGGRHDGVDHHGQSFDSWLEEEDFGAGPAQPVAGGVPGGGGSSYLFPNGPAAAYYVQPMFFSSHGYGFLLDQDELAHWRMDSDRQSAWTVEAAAGHLRYVVAPGRGLAPIAELTRTTGRQRVPPHWALGPQLDRLVYMSDTASTYYAKVLDDIRKIRQTHLPLTGYRIEGWALLSTAQLRSVITRLHAMGIHALLYYRAFAGVDRGGTEQPSVFSYALRHGYFTTTAAGAPYLFGSSFGGVAGVIDFTNPAAAQWFRGRIEAGLRLGADGFMADFGEEVQPDMHFADGATGATMHNHYATLYLRVVRQAVTDFERSHPARHIFFYNRAGYTGSARYEAANFPGDETTDFSVSSGLASLTPDMLNRAVGGAYGYTTDIGGYEDATTGATTKALFLRWAEWAALSPLFRDHGSADAGTHTPYSYDAQTLRTYIALSRLHQSAEPLIDSLWRQADRTGMPVTRPLWLADPGDPVAARQDQEWLLGPDVLVTPVVTAGATTRSAYLPAGCWRYVPTGRRYDGHRSVTVAAPLTVLAYFIRCGTTPFTPPTAAVRTVSARSAGSATGSASRQLPSTGGGAEPAYAAAALLAIGLVIRRRRAAGKP